MREKEIIILKTDKSGKVCVTTREEYVKMGEEHTKKDERIDRKGIIEKEKQLNGHVFFWAKMWGSGDDHNHKDRIIDSKVVSSEQLADMYLLYKDHKEKRATRPVVTGCNSNTRRFSNSVSDLLESVNEAKQNAYEVISGEDMFAKVERYNVEAEEIQREGREKLHRKMGCRGGNHKTRGTRILAGCEKLWTMKSKQAKGENEEQDSDQRCKDLKDEEVMKFRIHQYEENPTMKLSGEEIQVAMDCDDCGPCVTEYLLQGCDECGTSWVREDYTLTVIGNDVISLFPSLDSVNTGKIVREEVEKSTIKIDGFNVRLGLRYIVMNMEYT